MKVPIYVIQIPIQFLSDTLQRTFFANSVFKSSDGFSIDKISKT